MSKRILITCLLACLLVACDRQAARMDEAAEKCAEAVKVGALLVAEKQCTMALGENKGADLRPELRSERLYRLGNIMRAQAKYLQAQELIMQSLAIEEAQETTDYSMLARRLLEMSLIKAGLGQWQEGAGYLERLLPHTAQLDEQERSSMASILKHYAGRLENLQQAELAARFRDAYASLQQSQQETPEGTDSP
jgi:tetratricopeptide (TPR) repeat protein